MPTIHSRNTAASISVSRHSARDARIRLDDVEERRVRDGGDPAGRERADRVVHLLQEEAVQVHDVAGDVEGHDLAPAVLQQLVAAGEPLQDRAAMGGAVAVAHDVLVGADVPGRPDGALQGPRLVVGEGGEDLDLADHRMGHGRPVTWGGSTETLSRLRPDRQQAMREG